MSVDRTVLIKSVEDEVRTVLQVQLHELGAVTGEALHYVNRLVDITSRILTDPQLTPDQKQAELNKVRNTFLAVAEFEKIGVAITFRDTAAKVVNGALGLFSRVITGVIDRYFPPAPTRIT